MKDQRIGTQLYEVDLVQRADNRREVLAEQHEQRGIRDVAGGDDE